MQFGGRLQVADDLLDYHYDSIGYRYPRYKYQEAALQVAGTSGRRTPGHATQIDPDQLFRGF